MKFNLTFYCLKQFLYDLSFKVTEIAIGILILSAFADFILGMQTYISVVGVKLLMTKTR